MSIVLTGIKPTGDIHLGNYIGALAPILNLSEGNILNIFIADIHALNSGISKKDLKEATLKLAAALLALGLDKESVNIYKQSSIPEIFELKVLLENFCPKSLMNGSHAYKAATQNNLAENKDIDVKINMGLFNYPILMAADILCLNPDLVPVGVDQQQHIEIAATLASRINHRYGKVFKEVKSLIQNPEVIIGLDGRKMSKSYNNTIPLFCDESTLKKLIKSIATDSTPSSDPKPLDNNISKLYNLFASDQNISDFNAKLQAGLSYGEAKEELFSLINTHLSPYRERYTNLLKSPKEVEQILEKGANNIRPIAQRTLEKLKHKIGLL